MTELTVFQKQIWEKLPHIKLCFHEPMAKHTSFRIGGPAAVMAFPKNREELAEILNMSSLLDISFAILGAGTNILAPDGPIEKLVICLKDGFSELTQTDDTHIYVGAGVTMTRAAVFAANRGLAGMEFAHGIPGSVGGGVYMNAGAYGGEIKDICESVDIMTFDGAVHRLNNRQMDFSYRHSCLAEKSGIVIGATFSLKPGDPEQIRSRMQELAAKRKASQPLDKPSAGSAFKRPVGGYAAALIDEAGLKGYQIGGAAISEKHAGFAVNLGGATAEDVVRLLSNVSDTVFERTGIRLEPEVRIW